MSHPTFAAPDLTTLCWLDELGLEAVGRRLDPDRALLECRVSEPDRWCHFCGCEGTVRDTVVRRLAHVPFGHRPTTLLVRVRRYRCFGCQRVWRQDTSNAAEPRSRLLRGGLAWALKALVVDHLTISRVAGHLGVNWHTANDAVLAEGRRRLIDDPTRFEGVTTIGVDEHVWRHTRLADKYVTVIIDLTPGTRKDGPGTPVALYGIRRALHTGSPFLTNRQQDRIDAVFTGDDHIAVEVTWGIYQRTVAAYRDRDRHCGKQQLQAVIDALRRGVPTALAELRRLGRTLARRATDILAYFDLPGTSNGPTEALNGRLEHLRGSALRFRNLRNYVVRSLLETGAFKPAPHSRLG